MGDALAVDVFVEDRAHEALICALVARLARQQARAVDLRVRSARGGHSRVLGELKLYQRAVRIRGIPEMLVVAIDANCKSYAATRAEIAAALDDELRELAAIACPDPHVERWYMADPAGFAKVVGRPVQPGRRKCERDLYKRVLSDAVTRAGHVPNLGGIEFAEDIVAEMDFHRAGRRERSLKAFLDDLSGLLKRAGASAAQNTPDPR